MINRKTFAATANRIIAGVIVMAPKNGEEVLVYSIQDETFEIVHFFESGTVIDVGLHKSLESINENERIAAITSDAGHAKVKIQKTGFYKCYPAAGENEQDVYKYVNPVNYDYWVSLNQLGESLR